MKQNVLCAERVHGRPITPVPISQAASANRGDAYRLNSRCKTPGPEKLSFTSLNSDAYAGVEADMMVVKCNLHSALGHQRRECREFTCAVSGV